MVFYICNFFMFTFILTTIPSLVKLYPETRPKCEEIYVPMCRGIGYNSTSMPNQFHHEKQDEAGLEAHQFWPLVEINCSSDLKFFICSLYTPICIEDFDERLPPCRSVCERAQAGCAGIMEQYGFPWPEFMDCSNFPPYGLSDQLCMDSKEGAPPPQQPSSPSSSPQPQPPQPPPPQPPLTKPSQPSQTPPSSPIKPPPATTTTCNCRPAMEQSKFFLIPAFVCLICSILVIFTFFTNRDRFCYPERAIIFISGCFFMVSIGFILSYHFSAACRDCPVKSQALNCNIVFIFIYFFSMAASLWWVNLTLAWFLSASFKWSSEAIGSHSWYFHAVAWGLPSIKSFLAIRLLTVNSEPLTGICEIDDRHLMHFIIAPLCGYLLVGILFLLSGLISLMRIRRTIRKQVRQVTDKTGLVKLMVRIIIFSILYIVPTLVVIICNLYQYSYGPIWKASCPCNMGYLETPPYVTIHLLKNIATLVIGITTCFWIISVKTIESWWHCTAKILCCWVSRHPI